MKDHRAHTRAALRERRSSLRGRTPRRRHRHVAIALVTAALALAIVVVGAIDGGSTTRPIAARGQAHHARTAQLPRHRVAHREQLPAEPRIVHHVLASMPVVSQAGRRRREIALTFDDGPGPYTLAVARVLKHFNVAATFFQVGFMVHSFPRVERVLAADSRFVIGDHTQTHAMLTMLSPAAQQRQIDDQARILRANGLPSPTLFRPPYGLMDATTLAELRRREMLAILWTVDSEDYRRPGEHAIIHRVVAGARPGAIMLMHDAGGDRRQTIAALPRIIRRLRQRGYRLVTIPRLLHDDPPPRRQTLPTPVPGVSARRRRSAPAALSLDPRARRGVPPGLERTKDHLHGGG